eukprot:gene16003-15811_t
MDFAYSPKVQELRERVTAFMDAYVYPAEPVFERQVSEGDRWQPTAIMEELKAKAKAEGLWNLFLPESELGAGLTNLEYAPLAEIMGRSLLGPEPFNCSAPDTGNMEVLLLIFMGLSNPDAPRHQQHSMILVPVDAPGVKIVRPLPVFGYDDAPHGHAEVLFDNVRVPYEN